MRSEMKSILSENSTHDKRNSAYITFHCGRNEMKFRFGVGPRKTANSVKVNHSCFHEINACADVSFGMVSFRVVFT